MTDKEFLQFIRDRLVYVYGENPNFDYILRLDNFIANLYNQNNKSAEKPEDSVISWLNSFGIQAVRAENGYYDILNGFLPNIIYDAELKSVSIYLQDGTKTASVFKSENSLINYLKTGKLSLC